MILKKLIALTLITSVICGCGQAVTPQADIQSTVSTTDEITDWNSVINAGSNTNVNITMWGGNDLVNEYIDGYVADNVKEQYGITLNRVPMNAPDFVTKIFNEKKNNIEEGTIDILWINAENFRTLKDYDALYGPFTHYLPNWQQHFEDVDATEYDTGIAIDGKEALWGSAQLIFTYDKATLPKPPKTFEEILIYAKENPGKITYPNPIEDFVGAAFVRNAYFELTNIDYTQEYTYEEFVELSAPVIDYFKELHPYLWNEGEAFPATIALQNQMLLNGETHLSYGFEVFQTAGLIQSGEYPETFDTYLLESKTISNSHYLAIPFNSLNKYGAMLVIDFLQSPDAQIEKMKPDVWGDLSLLDINKLTDEQVAVLDEIQNTHAIIPISELTENRHEDMNAQYIDWVKKIWSENIIK